MAKQTRITRPEPGGGSELARFAQRAIDAFRDESPEEYKQLVSEFDGRGADLALLGGHGVIHVEVGDGQVEVNDRHVGKAPMTARGAAHPETLAAIMEGRMTPLDAFFKGDVVAQARSADLHRAYGYFTKYADVALRSEQLQKLRVEFEERYLNKRENDWAELS